ncbi:MAG: hypothetical protein EOO11_07980, partial [Chitinophagaceae bacterium]
MSTYVAYFVFPNTAATAAFLPLRITKTVTTAFMRKLFLLALSACLFCASAFSQAPNTISGLRLWLDATDVYGNGSTPANGSAVTTWVDKSGNGSNAIATGTTNPVYRASAIGWAGTIAFNRTQLVEAGFTVPGLDIRAAANPDVTIFTVYRQGSTPDLGQQAVWGNDNGGWDRFFFSRLNGNDGAVSRGQTASPFTVDLPGAGTPGLVRLLTTVYDGNVSGGVNNGTANGSAVYFNGQLVATTTDYTDASSAQSSFRIGFDGDDNFFQGEIAELIVYNRILTVCEIQSVNSYLGTKYGQAYGTPTITASGPTTICSGGSVTLTSSVTGGNQWQQLLLGTWTNISGMNNRDFVVNASGTFRVQVCNAEASAPVTITVGITPTATISGPSSACQNSTAAVTFTGFGDTGPYTFTYSVSDGSTTTSGLTVSTTGASTTATVSVPTATGGKTYTYTLTGVSNPSCSGAGGGSQSVVIAASADVNQPTNQTVCAGASTAPVTFSGTAASYT